MNVGSEILGFEVLATLGYGARSTIFAVKNDQNQIYALKRVVKNGPDDQRFLDQAIREHEVASQLDHPVLRKSLKIFRQRAILRVNEIYVLMEMVDGLTLEQFQPGSLQDLLPVCMQVAKGLTVMHLAGYVHADIKPNNILVDSLGRVKIIDFGQSCPIGTVKQRIQGTPDYIAPEQVMRKEITPGTDVFNLGATLYWLLTNQHIPTMIPKGQPGLTLRDDDGIRPPRDLNPEVPPALSNLVMQCLEKNPQKRPGTMDEMHDRMEIALGQIRRGHSPSAPVPRPD